MISRANVSAEIFFEPGCNALRDEPDAGVFLVADHRDQVPASRERADRGQHTLYDPDTLRLSIGLYSLVAEDEAGLRSIFEDARASFPGNAMRDETLESWRADTLSGTPDLVIERVRAFEAIGVEELIISPWVLPFAVPRPELLELFAEQVIAPLSGA